MTTTTIRVSDKTRAMLHELADAAGVPMQQIVERALESYRREQILMATNAGYLALKTNEDAWGDLEKERDAWDATLADGLEET